MPSIAIVVLTLAIQASAQSGEHYKWEIYGGYLSGQNQFSARQDNVTFAGTTQNITLCTPTADANFGANFEKLLCNRNTFHGQVTFDLLLQIQAIVALTALKARGELIFIERVPTGSTPYYTSAAGLP